MDRAADLARRIVEEVLAEHQAVHAPASVAVPASPETSPKPPADTSAPVLVLDMEAPVADGEAVADEDSTEPAPAPEPGLEPEREPAPGSPAALARDIVARVMAEHEQAAPPAPPATAAPPTVPAVEAAPAREVMDHAPVTDVAATPSAAAVGNDRDTAFATVEVPATPAGRAAAAAAVTAPSPAPESSPSPGRRRPATPGPAPAPATTALLEEDAWTQEQPAADPVDGHPLRWVLVTAVAAVALAVLLPMAVYALRALVP